MMRLSLCSFAFFCLLSLIWSGCELFSTDPDYSRIQEDEVDGIRFGMPMEDVIEKLGTPYGGGWVDDFTYGRFWFSKKYREGLHAGLSVYHIVDVAGIPIDTLYPADLFFMQEPYAGTTKHGIGIGSPFEQVQRVYGAPVDTLIPPRPGFDTWFALYCLGDSNLELGIRQDTVTLISLGYYYIPDDPDFLTCRK